MLYDKNHFVKSHGTFSFAKNNPLKLFGTILLIFAFIVQTFTKSFIVAGYYANTAAYAKDCENKAKPKLHCNGKCQMMKKLKQEENKDKQSPERKADSREEVLSSKSFYATLDFTSVAFTRSYSALPGRAPVDMPHSFFHPPGA